jgi:hypothetical protein
MISIIYSVFHFALSQFNLQSFCALLHSESFPFRSAFLSFLVASIHFLCSLLQSVMQGLSFCFSACIFCASLILEKDKETKIDKNIISNSFILWSPDKIYAQPYNPGNINKMIRAVYQNKCFTQAFFIISTNNYFTATIVKSFILKSFFIVQKR